jgi:hypothetical protein
MDDVELFYRAHRKKAMDPVDLRRTKVQYNYSHGVQSRNAPNSLLQRIGSTWCIAAGPSISWTIVSRNAWKPRDLCRDGTVLDQGGEPKGKRGGGRLLLG